jgi:P-type E1-E2 ATPase
LLAHDGNILVGLVAMDDPLVETVKEDLKSVADSGLKITIMSGDDFESLNNVAMECGVLTDKA